MAYAQRLQECPPEAAEIILGFKRRGEKTPNKEIPDFVASRHPHLLEYALKLCASRDEYLPLEALRELANWLGGFLKTRMLKNSGLGASLVVELNDVASGEARAWLEKQPKLAHLVFESPEKVLGSKAPWHEKQTAFERTRRREPARARALLENPPRGLKSDERTQLFDEMRAGLSKDDIPLLERENAWRILALIPGSKAWNELGEEACRWFSVARGTLQVTLPSEFSELFRRLDFSEKSIGPKLSDQESWLWELVYMTPLKYLEDHWKLSARELLDLFASSEKVNKFIDAVANGTQYYQDPDWARALLDRCEELAGPLGWLDIDVQEGAEPIDQAEVKRQFFSSLIPLLVPKEREIYCDKILDRPPNNTPALFQDVFEYLWSPPFTKREVESVARGDAGKLATELDDAFLARRRPLLYHSNSSVLAELPKLIPFKTPDAATAREDFAAGLQERDAIRKAFGLPT